MSSINWLAPIIVANREKKTSRPEIKKNTTLYKKQEVQTGAVKYILLLNIIKSIFNKHFQHSQNKTYFWYILLFSNLKVFGTKG